MSLSIADSLDFNRVSDSEDWKSRTPSPNLEAGHERVPSMFIAVCAVIIVALCSQGLSLACWFYNDDFLHLSYLHQAFSGHPEILLNNFTGPLINYKSVYLFYRPLTELSLALDFCIWKTLAVGFHITALVLHVGVSIALLFLAHEVCLEFRPRQRWVASLLSAAIFSCSPLYTEALASVATRGDLLCALFYVISLCAYLRFFRRPSAWLYGVGFFFFVLALFSKESACTLPLVVSLFYVLNANFSYGRRQIVRCLCPLWLMLVAFLSLRCWVLKTPIGGYVGVLGEDMIRDCLYRVFSLSALDRWLFPFNPYAFLNPELERLILCCLYVGIFASAVYSKWSTQRISLTSFLGGWAIVSTVIGLQASFINPATDRLTYMPMCAISILIAVLVVPLRQTAPKSRTILACVLATGLVLISVRTSVLNYTPWLVAADEEKTLQQECYLQLGNLGPNTRLVLLNQPYYLHGCMSVVMPAILGAMLKQPLFPIDWSQRIVLPQTQPGSELQVRPSQLRAFIKRPDDFTVFGWDSIGRKLLPAQPNLDIDPISQVNLSPRFAGKFAFVRNDEPFPHKVFENTKPGQSIDSYFLDLNEIDSIAGYDYLELQMRSPSASGEPQAIIGVTWNTMPAIENQRYDRVFANRQVKVGLNTVCLPLSEHCAWYSEPAPHTLRVDLVSSYNLELVSARLLSGARDHPKLHLVSERALLNDGSYLVETNNKKPLTISFDASKIEGCRKVLVELSKPNFKFVRCTSALVESPFQHYRNSQPRPEYCSKSWTQIHRTGLLMLHPHMLCKEGLQQLRVAALDKRGRVIGTFSDPLLLNVGGGM